MDYQIVEAMINQKARVLFVFGSELAFSPDELTSWTGLGHTFESYKQRQPEVTRLTIKRVISVPEYEVRDVSSGLKALDAGIIPRPWDNRRPGALAPDPLLRC